ncbi:hypothetical protein HPB47_010763 [Ixodes persulcatus]|uniref:Uncharacterized protein n=1 Tax=Ixodes persulcatus TaxID=34615 RepID=A0AC60NZ02_IXOPE|nr:hypothetical protein HPB47_010763 [Ixodes persulcatus]
MSRTGLKDKDKYESNNSRRTHSIMCPEDLAAGKKSHWPELEITGIIRNLSPALWRLSHLTCLYLNDNSLSRLPPGIGRLSGLQHLDLSCNKLRSLPAELGDLVLLQQLLLSHNYLRVLPYEIGKLFRLQVLGLKGNPLAPEILNVYSEPNGTSKLLAYLLDNLVGFATAEVAAADSVDAWGAAMFVGIERSTSGRACATVFLLAARGPQRHGKL